MGCNYLSLPEIPAKVLICCFQSSSYNSISEFQVVSPMCGSPYITGLLSTSYGNHIQYRSCVFIGRMSMGRHSLWAERWCITLSILKIYWQLDCLLHSLFQPTTDKNFELLWETTCDSLVKLLFFLANNLKIYTNKIFLSLYLTVPRTPVGHKNDHCHVVHITSGTSVLTYCTSLLKYPHTTMQCCYNSVNFLTNIHKRQLIARPSGMGCLL